MTKVTISPESEALILTVAEDVFRTKGFKRGTVRDISQQSEMSIGAVASIGSKEQLLVRVMERKITAAQRSSEFSIQAAVSSPATLIEHQLNSFFDLFEEEWILAREYAAILATGRYDSVVFPGLAQELIEGFRGVIQGDGRSARAAEVAQGIYLAYVGSLYSWASQGIALRALYEKQLVTTVRLLLE